MSEKKKDSFVKIYKKRNLQNIDGHDRIIIVEALRADTMENGPVV